MMPCNLGPHSSRVNYLSLVLCIGSSMFRCINPLRRIEGSSFTAWSGLLSLRSQKNRGCSFRAALDAFCAVPNTKAWRNPTALSLPSPLLKRSRSDPIPDPSWNQLPTLAFPSPPLKTDGRLPIPKRSRKRQTHPPVFLLPLKPPELATQQPPPHRPRGKNHLSALSVLQA